MGLTVDNAENNSTMMRALQKIIPTWSGACMRVRCFGHIVNLVVKVRVPIISVASLSNSRGEFTCTQSRCRFALLLCSHVDANVCAFITRRFSRSSCARRRRAIQATPSTRLCMARTARMTSPERPPTLLHSRKLWPISKATRKPRSRFWTRKTRSSTATERRPMMLSWNAWTRRLPSLLSLCRICARAFSPSRR